MPPRPRLRRLDRLDEPHTLTEPRRDGRHRVRVNQEAEDGVELSITNQPQQLSCDPHEIAHATRVKGRHLDARFTNLIRDRPPLR